MAKKRKRRCKHGVVKSGPRKGKCKVKSGGRRRRRRSKK